MESRTYRSQVDAWVGILLGTVPLVLLITLGESAVRNARGR
jgi:hypothetical protein